MKSDVDVLTFEKVDPGEWAVRVESPGSDRLLLAQLSTWGGKGPALSGPVYRYDAQQKSLAEAPKEVWFSAAVGSAETGLARSGRYGGCVHISEGRVTATCGDTKPRPVETRGDSAVWVDSAPTGELVAILTADGEYEDAPPCLDLIFPCLGSSGYRGQHYVELFTVPGMKRNREALRIPLSTIDGIAGPCWTADGRYIVYSSSDGKRVCIIRTDVEGE